jgi:hypothetical protein
MANQRPVLVWRRPRPRMKRWQVSLYACDGSWCGVLTTHWFRRAAERRARIESTHHLRLNQLLGSRWMVERVPVTAGEA